MESTVDSNNNAASGKYSLRPRNCIKRNQESPEEEDVFKTCTRARKSSPRGISLSKYRRKSANARERCRMREINAAFEALRRVVGWPSDSQGEKATKISTLRLAMSHITALSEALQESATSSGDSHRSTHSDEMFDDSDLSVGEFVMQEHSTTMSPDFHSSNQPQLSTISSPILIQQPQDFRNSSSGFQDISRMYSDSSALKGSSSIDYNLPTRCTSIMPHVNRCAGTQCDSFCDNQHSNSKPDTKFPSSGPLTSLSFHPGRESTPGQPSSFLGSSFQHTPDLDDCSTLLSTDIDTQPLHPISFEELFIT